MGQSGLRGFMVIAQLLRRCRQARNRTDGTARPRWLRCAARFTVSLPGGAAMKPDLIRVHIEMTDDGQMFARGADERILARGDHLADLRQNVDEAVRKIYG